ncbi:E3 ubiquitin-protein ligase RNF186-like [Sceloporus undulatus]|uniref:E3 ubiquitin-protein ligase RNF186-like n=1 Tax=Sceloporus undulatus TaxID=8520 RepID=UPI001C4CE1C4|nr:E3 ubiquitin-protein ligase RNF186-like [Sceloporus undulatus]
MDACELVKETMEKAPKEQMENTADEVGRFWCATCMECQGSDLPSLSAIESPTFSTPTFSVSLKNSDASAEKEGVQCLAADTDCPICFDQYGFCRPPKVLACQHVFCAVCLKLLLQNREDAWEIICPVCRKATTVFGGLICSLSTKEMLCQGTSANLNPRGEGPRFPDSRRRPESIDQEEDAGNREAAKRLLFLLLLLVLLVVLALPFVYAGLLKWALSIAVIWGLAMAGVLCWNPKWQCRRLDLSRKTESHARPVA